MNKSTIGSKFQIILIAIILFAATITKAQNWTALSTGLNGNVYSLCVYNGNLYAAGSFTSASGVSANNIAEWNGTTWDSVGHGTNDTIYSLCVYKGSLYAGGAFTSAGFVSASHIAKWNGTTWAAIGTGVNNNVYAMQVFDSLETSGNPLLYVGGSFTSAGGKAISYLAVLGNTRWDSVRRTAFDDKVQPGPNNTVRAMNLDPYGDLDVAGNFSGGTGSIAFAQFNATQWYSYNTETLNTKGILALNTFSSDLYMGGNAFFTTTKPGYIGYLSSYGDSNKWNTMGKGTNGPVYSLVTFGSNMYAGGAFDSAGGLRMNNLAMWTGTTWDSVGTLNGSVNSMVVYNGTLVIGGGFTQAVQSIHHTHQVFSGSYNHIAVYSLADPSISNKLKNAIICSGADTSYTAIATTSNAPLKYQWMVKTQASFVSVTNGGVYSGATLSTLTIKGATAAMTGYKYFCTVTNSASSPASANTDTATLTVNPTPLAPTVGSNGPLCAGGTLDLSSNSTGATSYNWTGPNSFTSASGTPSITNVTTAASGTYTVTAVEGACLSPQATLTVTINPLPTIPTLGSNPTPICVGGPLNLTTTSTGVTYNWTGPNAFVSNKQNPSITSATTAASGTYSLTVQSIAGCNSAVATIAITVNALPTIKITGTSNITLGSTDVLTGNGGVSYVWSSGSTYDTTIVKPTITKTYTVTGTGSDGCTDTASFKVTVNPSGIENIGSSEITSLYPNPATTIVNLSINMQGSVVNATIKIIDISGKEVLSTNALLTNGTIVPVNINGLAYGVYFIQVITDKHTEVLKFTKE